MKKTLSIILTLALVITMFTPLGFTNVEAVEEEFDTDRYGDVIDIGTKLRHLEKDDDYINDLNQTLLNTATTFNFNAMDAAIDNSNFTFNGGTKYFLGLEADGNYYAKTYTLRSLGTSVEIWVADDLSFPDDRPLPEITQEQVDTLRNEFDNTIYPTDTDFFGTPDSLTGENAELPALLGLPQDYYVPEDGVERIIILVDNVRDESYYDPDYPFFVAGFFSPSYEGYFDRNVISLDTNDWENRLESTFFGTTAHEFQHLIHSDNDSNEETWIDEGMADFAQYLCGYGHSWGHVNFFLDHPENSLVEWDDHYDAETGPETLSDYGQAYLLQLYLYDQYGKDFIQQLAKDERQGFTSINAVLEEYGAGIDFEELFRRFSIAVAIDTPWVAFDNTWFNFNNSWDEFDSDFSSFDFGATCFEQDIYNFESIDVGINFESALEYNKEGVPAWGADYIELEDAHKIRSIKFDGIEFMAMPWEVTNDPLNDGNDVLWGNSGNEVDNQAIIKADLTSVDSATLKFNNYIDIEECWDFGMVQVSTDNGETWTSLANENTRSDVVDEGYPKIIDNLPGFTGTYDDWTLEEFDLTPYAGQEIYITFRYLTDWGSNGAGWFIDDIEIPEIGFSSDCSSKDDFYSIHEIRDISVKYAVVFINKMPLGEEGIYRITSIDPFQVTEDNAKELREFFGFGDNYMVVWYAAPDGVKGVADYDYEIINWDFFGQNMKIK